MQLQNMQITYTFFCNSVINRVGVTLKLCTTVVAETVGVEKSYGDRFRDVTLGAIDGVDTVSGATRTSEAYKNAVKDALLAFGSLSSDGN